MGDAHTPEDVAAAAVRACQKIAGHFARLVGDAAMLALLERSLTLCAKTQPCLASAKRDPASSGEPPMWARLRVCLAGQEPQQTIETTVVLLATLLQLIARFIGDALVLSLLGELWPDVFLKSKKEKR